MFTIAAWSQSLYCDSVLSLLDAVPDQHIRTEGDAIYISEFNLLFGAQAQLDTTGTRARLLSPSLRRVNPFEIQPIDVALFPGAEVRYMVNPRIVVPLTPNEALECEIYDTEGAVPAQCTVVAWFAQGALAPVGGPIFSVRFEAELTMLAGDWGFAEIDLTDELPVGRYTVVGAKLVTASSVAFRFVPVGAHYRPGAPCSSKEEGRYLDVFRHGTLGPWFQFDTIQPPGIEVIPSADVAAETMVGHMDLLAI